MSRKVTAFIRYFQENGPENLNRFQMPLTSTIMNLNTINVDYGSATGRTVWPSQRSML
jgi:hypothetical protein